MKKAPKRKQRGGWPKRERVVFPLRLDPVQAERLMQVAERDGITRNELIGRCLSVLTDPEQAKENIDVMEERAQLMMAVDDAIACARALPKSDERLDVLEALMEVSVRVGRAFVTGPNLAWKLTQEFGKSYGTKAPPTSDEV